MTMRLSNDVRDAKVDAAVDLIDVGSGTAVLEVWSGSRPATLGDPPSGDKLAEFDLPDPCFGNSSAGTATANAIDPVVGLENGTVGFVVVRNKDGDALWDNDDVGVGSGQIQLNTLAIAIGVAVEVVSWTYTQPAT